MEFCKGSLTFAWRRVGVCAYCGKYVMPAEEDGLIMPHFPPQPSDWGEQ